MHAGATLKSGPQGDCLLHIPASPELPAKASPSVQLRYVQRPVFYREASGGLQAVAAPASIRGELSMEAQASVTVTGATISASEGDLTLPWLGQLGNFFAIGERVCPGFMLDSSSMTVANCGAQQSAIMQTVTKRGNGQ